MTEGSHSRAEIHLREKARLRDQHPRDPSPEVPKPTEYGEYVLRG